MKKTTSIILSLFLAHSASAAIGTVTLDEIDSKPPSRAKNFLIWQFLNQDITPEDAKKAFYQIDGVDNRFLKAYAAKTDEEEFRYVTKCLDINSDELTSIVNDDCLYLALNPQKSQKLDTTQRVEIYDRLNNKFGNVSYLLSQNRDDHFSPNSDINGSLELFLVSSPEIKQKYFNKPLTISVINELSQLSKFDNFVIQVATNYQLQHLQRSLSLAPIEKRSMQSNFFLGLMELKYGSIDKAVENFKLSKNSAYFPIDRDKNSFWIYLATKDENILKELATSLDINIYSLYASEKTGLKIENYFYELETKNNLSNIAYDPFSWYKLSSEIKECSLEDLYHLIDKYESKNTLAIQSYILESKYGEYIKNFTMAYDEYMGDITTDQKAMLYALMRQESQMIPNVISTSFALGLMQIMPFNVDAINKYHTLKVSSYNDMFNPQFNIAYAIEHMKHIDKTLKSPLFKAYAYNGGIGFAKRYITNGYSFKEAEYEPFMSMELMSNIESREYGKKVLSNYVIFKKILNEDVSIIKLIDDLTKPELTDSFRATK